MCFSATASFSAGILLTTIGIVAIKKVQHRSQILFASIPLIFAIQQFSEGILWLSLPHPEFQYLQRKSTFFFLIFAQIVWPLYIPVAILYLERKRTRRNIQKVLVAIGLLVSGYLAYCLYHYDVHAEIDGYHIAYIQSYPETFKVWGGLLYIIATIGPPFFSHIKRMWLLGLTVLISYIISELFYENYLVSVWCFFASVISISVLFIMWEIKKTSRGEIIKILKNKKN